MSVFMQPIFTQTVGSGGGNVVFNNIPQGFTDLKIVVSGRGLDSTVTNQMYMQVGGLSGFNSYASIRLYGNGSGVYSDQAYSSSGDFYYAGQINEANSTANSFSIATIKIANYTSSNFKQIVSDIVAEQNAAFSVQTLGAGLIRTTAPITQLTIGTFGTFAQYTTITLYGVAPQYSTTSPVAPTIGAVTDQAGFAAVSFTPTSSDNAITYAVTDNSSNTTYGSGSPIVAPLTLGNSTTFTAKAINSLGTASSATSSAVTSANSYASIATVTSPSGGTISFTNIPQNYTHLQLRVYVRGTYTGSGGVNENPFFRFNGSTAYQFAGHSLFGNGTGYSQSYTGINYGDLSIGFANAYLSSNVFGAYVIDILDYSNPNKNKTVRMFGGYDSNSIGAVGLSSTVMLTNDPIATISQFGGTSQTGFAAGSVIALYGIA